jgi:branched-chain amino acid transport system permease protein
MIRDLVSGRGLRLRPCGNFKERYEEEITLFETDFGRLCSWAGVVLLLGVLPFFCSPYALYVINNIGIAAIAAVGLNILIGYTGQISLGHGAFVGVGAYSAAVLATKLHVPFWLAVPAAGLLTAAVGMIFGIPSLRLKHLYLTIATLAGQFIIEYVLVHWESMTGGPEGIILPQARLIFVDIVSDRAFFWVIMGCFVVMTWMASNLMRTRFGRAFVAIRDNDRAAEGMGIPLFKYKMLSFAISSFYAGVAGALLAFYTVSITPEPFTLVLSIEYIAMIIIGGLGSIAGSVFGAVFIVLLNESLSWITEYIMNIEALTAMAITLAPLREFVFGLAIVVFIIFEPRGLAELWRIVRASFRLWPFSY